MAQNLDFLIFKIQAVTDNSTETASFADVTGATDYTYNPDGSLKSDANKGITLFEYNYLKLPEKVTFLDGKTISYQYSASGKKLKETTSTGDVTDYVGNVIYKNGSVYQVSHDEGRTVNNVFEYDINDHLGSLRVSFKDSLSIAKVTQESHTGVFGDILPSFPPLQVFPSIAVVCVFTNNTCESTLSEGL